MLARGDYPRLLKEVIGCKVQPLFAPIDVLTNDQCTKNEKHRGHNPKQAATQSKSKK